MMMLMTTMMPSCAAFSCNTAAANHDREFDVVDLAVKAS